MKGIWTIAALALFCLAPISAQGQTLPDAAGDQPALITADEIVYDEKAGIVTARGSVEISQSGRVLMADSVSYNTKTDVVSATGNVAILEKSGDVMFADYAEVTGDLREGFVRDIRILLSDNSRMAANSGTRSAGNITELDHAVYSPCELCREDPTRAPLWQIKAKKVVHDQEAKTITYRDASMEFFGIPILYLPYFQHPDPTVKRQSGFLLPSLQSSDQIGQLVQFPYFLVLSDTADVTLSPGFATKQSFVMGADYRQIFPKGALNLSGTGTIADYDNGTTVESDQFRWYVAGDGRVDLSSTFRAGFDLARTSDDTFMRVYSFGSPATMTSDAYVEGLRGRSYFRAETIAYQGLRATDVDGEIPIVLPSIAYQYVSDPGRYGGFWTIDGGLLSLLRTDGRDVRRASAAAQWVLPYTTRSGQVYKLTARLQADGYWATDYDPSLPADVSPVAGEEVFSGRIFPELALEWRYPMIRPGTRFSQTIEPIVQLRLAPNGANSDDIPNEDSTDLEFDIANLFTLNRFAGNDRVDPGPRLDYGFKWTAVGSNGGYTSVFLGQSFRFTDPGDLFIGGSGLEDRLSDIVGQVEFHPIAMASLSYRFQIDPDDFNFRRNELSLDIGPPLLNFRLDYISIDGQAYSGGGVGSVQREEFYGRASSQFTENWSAFASVRYDLSAERTLDERYGLRYNDECFLIEGVLERRHYTDRELEPDNVFFLRVALSNLGEITD